MFMSQIQESNFCFKSLMSTLIYAKVLHNVQTSKHIFIKLLVGCLQYFTKNSKCNHWYTDKVASQNVQLLFKDIPSVLVCMDLHYLTMLSRMYTGVCTYILYCYNHPHSTDSLHCLYAPSKVKLCSLYWWRTHGYVSET